MSTPTRITLALVILLAGLLPAVTRANGQLIIPIDQRLPPPQGFDFKGWWNCGDGISTAHLAVAVHHSSAREAKPTLLQPWTEVRESQDGVGLSYLVGYNTDTRQFLLIDAANPSSISYQTTGWQGSKLVLVALTDETQLPHRLKFDVTDSSSFTVTWEMRDGTAWKEEPSFTCRRRGTRDAGQLNP